MAAELLEGAFTDTARGTNYAFSQSTALRTMRRAIPKTATNPGVSSFSLAFDARTVSRATMITSRSNNLYTLSSEMDG